MDRILSIDASSKAVELVLLEVPDSADFKDIKIEQSVSVTPEQDESLASAIKRASIELSKDWDDTVLFLHAPSQSALNITMPFSDDKRLSKLIPSEVQDLVPFDTDEFIISYQHTGSINGSGQDIHVSLCPTEPVKQILEELKGTSAEPRIITSPTSGLQGLYEFFGSELEPNASICILTDEWTYIGFVINKKLVSQRMLKRELFADQVWGSIESAIRNIEIRYEISLPILYRIIEAKNLPAESLTAPHNFNRTIKDLSLASLFPHLTSRISLTALLGSVFGRSYPNSPKVLSDFRKGNFAYRPPLREVINGLKVLMPLILITTLTGILALGGWYAAREYQIRSLRKTLSDTITESIPGFTAPLGQEAQSLNSITQNIQDSLKDLGSPLASPPLMVLAALSDDIKSVDGITVTRASIKNGEVKIDGSAPNYRTLNRLEVALKKRKSLFCRIKTDNPGRTLDNARDFQMVLTLCD
jgi:hypothetical protein